VHAAPRASARSALLGQYLLLRARATRSGSRSLVRRIRPLQCTDVFATVELLGLGMVNEPQHAAGDLREFGLYLSRCGVEVLATEVHPVDPAVGEAAVQLGLDAHSIVGEEKSVYVESERHGSIAEFAHAVHRIQSPSHSDLEDSLTERADVANEHSFRRENSADAAVTGPRCTLDGLRPASTCTTTLAPPPRGRRIEIRRVGLFHAHSQAAHPAGSPRSVMWLRASEQDRGWPQLLIRRRITRIGCLL